MLGLKSPEVIKQIETLATMLEKLKVDIQITDQTLQKNPALGTNALGPLARIVKGVEDCVHFFESFKQHHGLSEQKTPTTDMSTDQLPTT